jgi:hypothetical protein
MDRFAALAMTGFRRSAQPEYSERRATQNLGQMGAGW